MRGVWQRQHSGYRWCDRAGVHEQAARAEVADDVVGGVVRRAPGEPAVGRIEVAGLVDGGQDGEVLDLAQLEVVGAGTGGDVHDAGALLERHLVPADDAVRDGGTGTQRVEGPLVAQADELRAADDLLEGLVRAAGDGQPVAVGQAPVLGGGGDGRGHVGGQRPGGGGPDDDVLARPIQQGEADGQRRVLAVDVAAGQLVLRDRGAAAGAPLGGPMPAEEPAPLVDGGQEPPDVLDVGVGEGEVVAAPVHPLPESDRPLREIGGGALDDGPAAAGELGQPELLDLALRVEAELSLDADLDPQPLAVEAVLVALVVAPERLVALEDVLERATPRRVDGERLVGRDRAVDEAEAGAVGVLRRGAGRTCARGPRDRGSPARGRHDPASPGWRRT